MRRRWSGCSRASERESLQRAGADRSCSIKTFARLGAAGRPGSVTADVQLQRLPFAQRDSQIRARGAPTREWAAFTARHPSCWKARLCAAVRVQPWPWEPRISSCVPPPERRTNDLARCSGSDQTLCELSVRSLSGTPPLPLHLQRRRGTVRCTARQRHVHSTTSTDFRDETLVAKCLVSLRVVHQNLGPKRGSSKLLSPHAVLKTLLTPRGPSHLQMSPTESAASQLQMSAAESYLQSDTYRRAAAVSRQRFRPVRRLGNRPEIRTRQSRE